MLLLYFGKEYSSACVEFMAERMLSLEISKKRHKNVHRIVFVSLDN